MDKKHDNEHDLMWVSECEKLLPWLYGQGIDIGAGGRSISKDIIRVDIDEKVKPDFVCSGDDLPFNDGEFDYLVSIHSFEHFTEPVKTLKEWLRVVRAGGIVAIVHPDITYTQKQKPAGENWGLKENPYNKHFHEHTADSFVAMLNGWTDLPFRIIDYGLACEGWSFYVILKKT